MRKVKIARIVFIIFACVSLIGCGEETDLVVDKTQDLGGYYVTIERADGSRKVLTVTGSVFYTVKVGQRCRFITGELVSDLSSEYYKAKCK